MAAPAITTKRKRQSVRITKPRTGFAGGDDIFIVDEVLSVRRAPASDNELQWLVSWEGFPPQSNTVQSTESLLYCSVWRDFCDKISFPWRNCVVAHELITGSLPPPQLRPAPGAKIAECVARQQRQLQTVRFQMRQAVDAWTAKELARAAANGWQRYWPPSAAT